MEIRRQSTKGQRMPRSGKDTKCKEVLQEYLTRTLIGREDQAFLSKEREVLLFDIFISATIVFKWRWSKNQDVLGRPQDRKGSLSKILLSKLVEQSSSALVCYSPSVTETLIKFLEKQSGIRDNSVLHDFFILYTYARILHSFVCVIFFSIFFSCILLFYLL